MGGALARSLSAAASSAQEVGTAETLSSAQRFWEGVGKLDVGAVDWVEEVANEMEMEGVADSERSRTSSPTPIRWGSGMPAPPGNRVTPTPVPVPPTKGGKRMAMDTPRPTRLNLPVVRPMLAGFAAPSALEQILAAIPGVERKLEKVAALEARMVEGMEVLATEENERENRLAVKLLAMDDIESDLVDKGR